MLDAVTAVRCVTTYNFLPAIVVTHAGKKSGALHNSLIVVITESSRQRVYSTDECAVIYVYYPSSVMHFGNISVTIITEHA
jgi:hypothetical protein